MYTWIRMMLMAIVGVAAAVAVAPVLGQAAGADMAQDHPRRADGRVRVVGPTVRWVADIGRDRQPTGTEHWQVNVSLQADELFPRIEDVINSLDQEALEALPDGIYPAAMVEPTTCYIEILTITDDQGGVLYDATRGDGTLPRPDVMYDHRIRSGSSTLRRTANTGFKIEDESVELLTITGNAVIPRYLDLHEVVLPLEILRAAPARTLSFGRGRLIKISERTTHASGGTRSSASASNSQEPREYLEILVVMGVQHEQDVPIRVLIEHEDGRREPIKTG